MQELMVNTH